MGLTQRSTRTVLVLTQGSNRFPRSLHCRQHRHSRSYTQQSVTSRTDYSFPENTVPGVMYYMIYRLNPRASETGSKMITSLHCDWTKHFKIDM